MSLYIILYIITIFSLILISFLSIRQNGKFLYGKFLFLSTFFYSLWLTFYLVSFVLPNDSSFLLILSKLLYGLSLLSIYFILLFIYTFGKKYTKLTDSKVSLISMLILCVLFFISIFTPYIISGLVYNPELKIYYESFGELYFIYTLLYLIQFPLFLVIGFFKFKELNSINKIRFKFLFSGFLFLLFNVILFLALLPILGIWVMQKEVILFFIPLILSVWYTIYRYNFLDIKILFGKILSFVLSFLFSFFVILSIKFYFLNLPNYFSTFWGITHNFGALDLFLGIILFLICFNLINNNIFGNSHYILLTKKISKIKKKISYISNLTDLNRYLNLELSGVLNSNYSGIKLFSSNNFSGLKSYFLKNTSNSLFINDIVFIEENKNKFDYEKIKNEINLKAYLVFPIYNNSRDLIGFFEIGYRKLKDPYTVEEIEILKDFTEFLSGHLKYIEIYSNIYDLNINLDKKVDEKTIEYNQLLNKQTEFISMASHELRSPIGASIMQLDSMIDELEYGELPEEKLKKELGILNGSFIKVGDLVNKIFSVQKYDLDKIKLYKQDTDLYEYLSDILDLFNLVNPDITIERKLERGLNVQIDRIQFKQVIDNLLNNALKFCDSKNKLICLSLSLKSGFIEIIIEDNGSGFKGNENKDIFDKYVTNGTGSIGIGLGLYLCKTIVDYHDGNISAENSDRLGGASFIIRIPNSN